MKSFGIHVFLGFFIMSSHLFASEWQMDEGVLEINGELSADRIIVQNGASIIGSGALKGASSIAGTLSPGKSETETATLMFLGPVTFQSGSSFECYAATHTSLDKLIVSGNVMGTCTVVLSKAAGAIPLNQIVVDASQASDFDRFSEGGSTPENWQLTSTDGNLMITERMGDSDGDGMPDCWENSYYHSRTAANPESDTDLDGMKNSAEEIAGTNPTNSASRLFITGIEPMNTSQVAISWTSASNRLYTLYQGYSISNGIITIARDNMVANPPLNTATFSISTNQIFYKISVRKQ